jgi:hypothetical protein
MTLSEYAATWDDMEAYIAALESVCTEQQLRDAAEIVSPGCTDETPIALEA